MVAVPKSDFSTKLLEIKHTLPTVLERPSQLVEPYLIQVMVGRIVQRPECSWLRMLQNKLAYELFLIGQNRGKSQLLILSDFVELGLTLVGIGYGGQLGDPFEDWKVLLEGV